MAVYLLTIKKLNSETVWMVFRINGRLMARQTNSTKWVEISKAPKYIQEYVIKHNVKNWESNLNETVIL